MFGLTFEKLLLIGVIAVFVLGPERLPGYAAKLAQLVRTLRDMANGAKERMRDEMGPEFDDVDWKKLDPRQYDPRRIIREALLDDEPGGAGGSTSPSVRPVSRPVTKPKPTSAGGPAAAVATGAAAAGATAAATAGDSPGPSLSLDKGSVTDGDAATGADTDAATAYDSEAT
ncbi:Sec-independent protein translocase TatB [Herbiconiux sp. P15]|uniref:Sec-independent protein translocase TatB n=1 Tax=Herbiconiux liukaitaii TaxID=3342799 RepID=UPI0035B92384